MSILSEVYKVDPCQRRFLACLTKIDIMDRGTNAAKTLLNEEIPLRYGYVGVKNRSSYSR
jgi:vacuolar protein sorting-associated protein 1